MDQAIVERDEHLSDFSLALRSLIACNSDYAIWYPTKLAHTMSFDVYLIFKIGKSTIPIPVLHVANYIFTQNFTLVSCNS